MNMKFGKKSQTIERIKDFAARSFLLLVCGLLCLWMISGAKAATQNRIESIKGESLGSGSFQVVFEMAAPPKESDVQVKFDRNFIQFSLSGVSAFPARTVNLSQQPFERVFTYQYQPDQARARILLSQNSIPLQASSSWKVEGKTIVFQWKAPSSDAISITSAAAKRESIDRTPIAQKKIESVQSPAPPNTIATDPAEEKARQDVLQGAGSLAAPVVEVKDKEQLPLFTEKQKTVEGAPTPKEKGAGAGAKIFASLLLVIGIIGAVAAGFRRFVLGRGVTFNGSGKTIEVVSQKGLGPKRSIALVRVLDQYMILGLAGDNINLLSNLGNDPKIEKLLDQAGGSTSFADTFATAVRPNVAIESSDSSPKKETPKMSMRDLIKKRVEGFKPL
jgi:flagellar biogenesis protein FliO